MSARLSITTDNSTKHEHVLSAGFLNTYSKKTICESMKLVTDSFFSNDEEIANIYCFKPGEISFKIRSSSVPLRILTNRNVLSWLKAAKAGEKIDGYFKGLKYYGFQ